MRTHDMRGILIYTAAGDAEGTLGGLVRQGEPCSVHGSSCQRDQAGDLVLAGPRLH